MAHRQKLALLKIAPLAALALLGVACSTTPALTLSATPNSVGGDGQSAVTAVAKVTSGGGPAPDGTAVTFTATDGTLETTDMTPAANPLSLEVDSSSGASTALLVVPRRGHGTITITASASFNGATVTESQTITLVPSGGLATSLSMTCTSQNVGGMLAVAGLAPAIHVLCTPIASDAQGNTIKNASIEPYAEAGILAWQTDPTTGDQYLIYTINPGATPPIDVDPFGPDGMPRPVCPAACINDPTMCDAEPCWVGNGVTHNPRDGVATLMVAVPGVPGFFDQNSNGEPFVDANDNGTYDPGEFYLDVNGNGMYDSAASTAGAMQDPRMLWRAYRIVWSGAADTTNTSHGSSIQGQVSGATLNNLTVRLNDANYNKLAADNPADNFSLSSSCTNNGSLEGNAFSTESGIVLDTVNPGILFDPVTGDITLPGEPSTYRQETDINLQTNYGAANITGNTDSSTCSVTATVTRTYDPGAEPLFDPDDSLSSESVTNSFAFAAPPDGGS